jgi:hypothetical protein
MHISTVSILQILFLDKLFFLNFYQFCPYPNTPEADQMVIMMNKSLPAYVGFSLRDQGLPESFLLDLLKQSCCPTLVVEINTCTWDLDSGVLTTQRETNKNWHLEELEKAAWFKNAFDDLGLVSKGVPKRPAPPPETLFNLDEDHSVKTTHLRHENCPPPARSTPPRKSGNEIVNMTNSKDEHSISSSCDEGLRVAATNWVEEGPSSSDGDNGMAPSTTGCG